jgi:hypothetical protein
MNKKSIFVGLILFISIMISTGCFDIDDSRITYESHATKVRFTISYGYLLECSGSGDYEINYDCDTPEVLSGQIYSTFEHNSDYEEVTIATFNDILRWAINSDENVEYDLGITTSVLSESYLVSDLTGANALTIPEINNQHSDIVTQYCRAQSNETTTFIDTDDPVIKAKANEIYNAAGADNAFLVAKELFIWLKENTAYQIHTDSNDVQPASVTFNCKTGDCDDLSFLYISLCRSIGIPARFIRGILVDKESAVSHAWVEVYVGGGVGKSGWIPVECAGTATKTDTEVNQNFGVESAGHLRLFKDNGSDESMIASISGISYKKYSMNRDILATSFIEVNDFFELKSQELKIDENGYRSYQ